MKPPSIYRFLAVLTICSALGLQTWRTLFNNFAVEIVGLEGSHIGIIQSVREIPGFLTFLAVFAMLLVQEHRLSAISILLLGIGVGASGAFPSYGGILATTLIMSFGFHYYETTNQSLTLQHFDSRTSPLIFGRLRSLAAAANIAAGIIIYLAKPFLSYAGIYLGIGGAIAACGIWGFFQNPTERSLVPQRKKLVFRKRYRLFYFLTFMAGARRQIFVVFSVFLLVKKFQFTVEHITLLFVLNNIINYFLSPIIGKSIVRFGERMVLSVEYLGLIFVFIAYAMTQSPAIASILYILDHIFFNFSMAIRTYFQKVGDSKDIAPTMAVGFTINHIAAVVIPAIGGFLWMVDYRIPFFCGAVLSAVSLAAVQRIRTQPEN